MDHGHTTPEPTISAKAAAYVWGVILLGAAVTTVAGWDLAQRPIAREWIILLVLTIATGWASLRIPSMPITFSISDTFSIVAALIVGPSAGALTAAVDGLVLSYRLKSSRRTAMRVLFNMASPAIASWVAAQVFFWLAGPQPLTEGALGALRLLLLLTVFAGITFGLNTGTVATAIALERGGSVYGIWRTHFVGLWMSYLGGVFASMLMMVLSTTSTRRVPIGTLEVLILIAPLPVILYAMFRHALGRAEDQITHLGGMNRVYVAAIEALAQAIDAKDQVTHDHIRRVQDNSVRLARALDVTDDLEVQALKAASLLHDVGKISVPEHILNKPGRLSPSEMKIMQRHAPVGADILSVIGFPYPVEPIVRHHHENWDGTGYPDRIAGEQIPIGARILAVVDCFDALTSDRPYRPALSDEAAIRIIAERRGTMYDPRVVDAFFALHAAEGAEAAARTTSDVVDPHQPVAPARDLDDDPTARLDLEAFYELGSAVSGATTAHELGESLWAHLRRPLAASAFTLLVYDDATDALVPVYAAGLPTIDEDARVPLGERLSGWVAATRQTIVNSDARLDFDGDIRAATPLRSAMAVPVCAGDRAVAVVAFYSERVAAFSDVHQRLAEAAAYVVSRQRASLPVTAIAPAMARRA